MRKRRTSNRTPQLRSAVVKSIPAPVGGWNARDALSDMAPDDAVVLDNWLPGTSSVEIAPQSSIFANIFSGSTSVNTLMTYSGGTSNKLFAGHVTSIYNITSGTIGAADLSGLTNTKWQYINVATSGGNYLEMCNGADGVYTYDGTNWTDQSAAITGVTATNLININLFKNRVWFIEIGTLRAWYLPTGSITGAASALDLRTFCVRGGYLMAMGTWTVDAGYGVDDHAVFITSNGEVLVYRGTDPASASTWMLIGVWYTGSPLGRRCFYKYQGDLLLINQDGLFALSSALQSSRVNPKVALTDKIRGAITEAINSYGTLFGWQIIQFPKKNLLILNVPLSSASSEQFLMNTITGAWCRMTGHVTGGLCMEIYNDDAYIGCPKMVIKFIGGSDGQMPAAALQAFNYFGSRGQTKRFTMMRPNMRGSSPGTDGNVVNGNINVDFSTTPPAPSLSFPLQVESLWDSATFDSSVFGDLITIKQWSGAASVGYCGAPYISTIGIKGSLEWISTDVMMEPGGAL